MYTSVFVLISAHAIHTIVALTVHRVEPFEQSLAKSRIELKSIEISCTLGDILVLTAPLVLSENVKYYLYNPRGEFSKLNVKRRSYKSDPPNNIPEYGMMSVKFTKEKAPVLTSVMMYSIFNMNDEPYNGTADNNETDIFKRNLHNLGPNQFMLGPLSVIDFGNWVISAFYEDEKGVWTEVFQSFAVMIMELLIYNGQTKLKEGATFEPMFPQDIRHLTSCELVVPKASVDRFYTRNEIHMARCGYIVPNVTMKETGMWRIVGIGDIIYETLIFLEVTA